MKTKVLFICQNESYIDAEGNISFLEYTEMQTVLLSNMGIESRVITNFMGSSEIKLSHVAMIEEFAPSHIIVEDLCIPFDAFEYLKGLPSAPLVTVRMRSEMGFAFTLSSADPSILYKLGELGVFFAAASATMQSDLFNLLKTQVFLLPDYHSITPNMPLKINEQAKEVVHIGCFGIVGLLNNTFAQLQAALKFGEMTGLKINFHAILQREDAAQNSIVENMVKLMENVADKGHTITWHEFPFDYPSWKEILKGIDLGMQVTFSESYCHMAADMVDHNIPVIGGANLPSIAKTYCTDAVNIGSMALALLTAYKGIDTKRQEINKSALLQQNRSASAQWTKQFESSVPSVNPAPVEEPKAGSGTV